MAEKEVKKALSEESIEDFVKKNDTPSEEIAKNAAEEIAKKRKEKLTQETVSCMEEAEWERQAILLDVKRSRKVSEVQKDYLKLFSNDEGTGIYNKLLNGDLSVDEYRKQRRKLYQEQKEKIANVDKLYNELDSTLDKKYDRSYAYRSNRRYGDW